MTRTDRSGTPQRSKTSYLDTGKAAIDHYGTATVTSHHAENVCSALGA
jgi:hypothetical protein